MEKEKIVKGNYKVDKSHLVDKIYKLHQVLSTNPESLEQTFEEKQPNRKIVEIEITSDRQRKAA